MRCVCLMLPVSLLQKEETACHAAYLSPIFSGLQTATLKPKSTKSMTAEELKASIKRLAAPTSNGVKASQAQREALDEMIKKLEKMNKVKNTAKSDIVGQGSATWRLVYTDTDSTSSGKLGPFVGEVLQKFDWPQKKYTNFVQLGPDGAILQAALGARWEPVGSDKWNVVFESIAFRILGVEVKKKEFEGAGTWRLTYIDPDMRILYAASSRRPEVEHVYVLEKSS